MVGEAKWKPLVLPEPWKTVNPKQYCIHGGILESSGAVRDLKDEWVVVPTTSVFNYPVWPVQVMDASGRMVVDHCKLNQVVTPVAAVVPDAVSLLERINSSLGTWYAAIASENALFSLPVHKGHQNQYTISW